MTKSNVIKLLPEDVKAADASSKTESAYLLLRQAILDAELAPGLPLRQSNLHDTYGIGWTPLREALSRLEAERLVVMERNRGFFVAPVSMAELEDLSRARGVLELALVKESIEHGDAQWEDALIVAHFRLKSSSLQPENWGREAIKNWLNRHHTFHLCLVSGCSSFWLEHLYKQVMDQERRHLMVLMFGPLLGEGKSKMQNRSTRASTAELFDAIDISHHTELMEAAISRDLAKMLGLMNQHVGFKTQVYVNAQKTVPPKD